MRMMTAWFSPSMKLSTDHYSKMKAMFKIAVDLFNELFPELPLITKEDTRDIEQNRHVFVLDRQTPSGGAMPYSKFYLGSTDVKAKNPGSYA